MICRLFGPLVSLSVCHLENTKSPATPHQETRLERGGNDELKTFRNMQNQRILKSKEGNGGRGGVRGLNLSEGKRAKQGREEAT